MAPGDGTATEEQRRSSEMKRIRILTLAVLAVFALGAITATAAQAEKGPFWKICQKHAGGKFKDSTCKTEGAPNEFESLRLLKGETEGITAKASKAFTLTGAGIAIKCTKLHLEPGATINGSTGANFGFSQEVILFEGCTVEKNGEPCEPYSEKEAGKKELGKIRTEPVENKLDFETGKLKIGEKLLLLFQPNKNNKEKAVFVKVKFTGAGCKAPGVAVEGSVAGEAWQEGKAATLGSEKLTVINEVNFPKTQIKVDWLEEEGIKKEVKVKLTIAGLAAELEGRAEIELANKQDWGAFTK